VTRSSKQPSCVLDTGKQDEWRRLLLLLLETKAKW